MYLSLGLLIALCLAAIGLSSVLHGLVRSWGMDVTFSPLREIVVGMLHLGLAGILTLVVRVRHHRQRIL